MLAASQSDLTAEIANVKNRTDASLTNFVRFTALAHMVGTWRSGCKKTLDPSSLGSFDALKLFLVQTYY